MGPEAAAGLEVLNVELLEMLGAFEGGYKQHSAALKHFRNRCEIERNDEGFVLSNSHKAAVAAIVHPPGTEFWFEETDMVSQLDEDSLRYVVEDGDCNRGLVGCEFRRRTSSYDHTRQVQEPANAAQKLCWDFVLKRSDGTAVRLHPEWSKPPIATWPVEGHASPVDIPSSGLGKLTEAKTHG